MKHTIKGTIKRQINSRADGTVIGFEIEDEDVTELPSGARYNQKYTVWGNGNLPPVGSIVELTATDYYETVSEWNDINDGTPQKGKQRNLRNLLDFQVLHEYKETQQANQPAPANPSYSEGAPF